MSVAHNDEVLNARELAEFLGVDPTFIYKQARKGQIPGWKVGSIWFFSRKVIVEKLRGGVISTAEDTKQ